MSDNYLKSPYKEKFVVGTSDGQADVRSPMKKISPTETENFIAKAVKNGYKLAVNHFSSLIYQRPQEGLGW